MDVFLGIMALLFACASFFQVMNNMHLRPAHVPKTEAPGWYGALCVLCLILGSVIYCAKWGYLN